MIEVRIGYKSGPEGFPHRIEGWGVRNAKEKREVQNDTKFWPEQFGRMELLLIEMGKTVVVTVFI